MRAPQTRNVITNSSFPLISILGIPVNRLSITQALDCMAELISDGRGHMVITLNTEMLMLALHDDRFRIVIESASLVLPDAMGLIWASRILGYGLVERVAGVDTIEKFASVASTKGYRLFLLGAAPGVADRVGEILKQRHPGLIVAGTYSGSPAPAEDDAICRIVNEAKADVLLVAYGVPEQEFWIARNLHRINIGIVINVGGTFDFIAGVAQRAPRWMQKVGLEWFHRLLRQPQRWRRMLVLPQFAVKVLAYRLSELVGKAQDSHSL